ncbi:11943_t:CDS:2, partial [Funneliformis mosseae]
MILDWNSNALTNLDEVNWKEISKYQICNGRLSLMTHQIQKFSDLYNILVE